MAVFQSSGPVHRMTFLPFEGESQQKGSFRLVLLQFCCRRYKLSIWEHSPGCNEAPGRPTIVHTAGRLARAELHGTGASPFTFLTTSQTGNRVILGGKGVLQVFSVVKKELNGRVDHSLKLEMDFSGKHGMQSTEFTCSACLLNRKKDFITVGTNSGQIYGILCKPEDKPDDWKPGSFHKSENKHEHAIRSLITTHGSDAWAHHRPIQESGTTYSYFLQYDHRTCEQERICTLDASGKLLHWQKTVEKTWVAEHETNLVEDSGRPDGEHEQDQGAGRFVAGLSSRLAPHVTIIADSSRKALFAIDRSNPDVTPCESLCSYV